MNNYELVSRGLHALLKVFAPYVCSILKAEYGAEWWQVAVMGKLRDMQKQGLPESGAEEELVASLDIQRCLILFDVCWQEAFRKRLSVENRTWAKELISVRNKLAHIGASDFNDDDTWRALDTMSRLCDQTEPEAAEGIRAMLREFRYGSAEGSMAVTGQTVQHVVPAAPGSSGILTVSPDNLPSWREVIEPHPDVAQGRYRRAEFAADLAQVARGEGSYEYRDPVEFFARTYITAGMKGLLVQALKRVSSGDGDPVIQLQTAFGGGKTHSMLALYHLLRGSVPLDRIPAVRPLLQEAGLTSLPKVHVATLVGTALNPSNTRRPQKLPGVTIHTLWGEIAAQLAYSAGNPRLYDFIREADRKGTSPGSETLKELFDACGPCLVLMDELVAYGRRIYGVDGLPAGSYDNFTSFIHEIAEAAVASRNSLVVGSIPESDIEVGGEVGIRIRRVLEKELARVDSIWKPVEPGEGFEVVRRRLFLDCKNEAARDMVCTKFSQMYNENPTDFPMEARDPEYRRRLVSCYPIHPEVFDRLYDDWATLEHFQRTRGVLRLMATVIHELWMGNDAGLLIMPGSLPLNSPGVRDELTRYLPDGWNSVVDREVDGKSSLPFQEDRANPRYGRLLAARRVARTIMLGSAPTVRQQKVRGIEASRIRLGVVQPGEQIAVFNDARGSLQNKLAYLYSNASSDRFWYDTRPTLRKTAEDRASQIADTAVEEEIERRLRGLRREPPFAGVHLCPASSLDVPDEQNVRLVVLGPADGYVPNAADCPAMQRVRIFLADRGQNPRTYRNMLVFLAADQASMEGLKQDVRRYLAWSSVQRDSQELNLDAAQNRETENSLVRSNETVGLRLKETWCWILVPAINRSDGNALEWSPCRLRGGEGILKRVAEKLVHDERIIEKWSSSLLLQELDGVLWKKDQIKIDQLWEYLCTYCYLPRLAGYRVLEDAIKEGIKNKDFAYAENKEKNRFINLVFGEETTVSSRGYLVSATVAEAQKEAEKTNTEQPDSKNLGQGSTAGTDGTGNTSGTSETGGQKGEAEPDLPVPPLKHFFLSSQLDITRINRTVQNIVEEVINILMQDDNVNLNVTIDVQADAPKGFQPGTVRGVKENCQTLKIRDFGFDEKS